MPTKYSVPLSLYDITVAAICECYNLLNKDIKTLPGTILFDVFVKLYEQDRVCLLCMEFNDLDLFSKMLNMNNNRLMLIKCFQALMRHGTGFANDLVRKYIIKCDSFKQNLNHCPNLKESTIDLGIKLGGFLNDAGWLLESSHVLEECKNLCLTLPDVPASWRKMLDCCHELLHAQVVYSMFAEATKTKELAEQTVQKLKDSKQSICLAGIYTQFSVYCFNISNYNQSYMWSVKAVRELDQNSNSRLVVEALSQASKSCVVKKEFNKAESLVRMAVFLAAEAFGTEHLKYAEALLHYGFYLLNLDYIKESVMVYEKALILQDGVFGSHNLHVAVTHGDLAYALYVHEYSSGRFNIARHHVETAISTMTALLPGENLLLAEAQRVKALILEEIAIDHVSNLTGIRNTLFLEAEKLHKNVLRLALLSFGEDNVQTAKHYGNLGRLYQSMKKYQEAESMHLKAIEIKQKLLGPDDYEVGLSVGHLASLYSYDMKEYRKAESLYIRSINISLKLFTECYFGLGFDYLGLIHIYQQLGEVDNVNIYQGLMQRWKSLREVHDVQETALLALDEPPSTLQSMKALFDDDQEEVELE